MQQQHQQPITPNPGDLIRLDCSESGVGFWICEECDKVSLSTLYDDSTMRVRLYPGELLVFLTAEKSMCLFLHPDHGHLVVWKHEASIPWRMVAP